MRNKRPKRIFAGHIEISGFAMGCVNAWKKLGIHADLVTFCSQHHDYAADINLHLENKRMRYWPIFLGLNFIKCLIKYDYFLFTGGSSLFPWYLDYPILISKPLRYLDYPILKLFRKKMIMVFSGCDIKHRDLNPYPICHECDKICSSLDIKKRKVKAAEKYMDHIISHPIYSDLLSRKYHYFWMPIDIDSWKPINISNPIPVVVHVPFYKWSRLVRGTKYVLEAVEKLKNEGIEFKFILVEGKTPMEAKEIVSKCDIYVDRLVLSWHGLSAVEAMALGKPVLGNISQEEKERYSPNVPVINTTPKTLYDNLKLLIQNDDLRKEIGQRSRKYIEEYHDADKIAQEILELFVNS